MSDGLKLVQVADSKKNIFEFLSAVSVGFRDKVSPGRALGGQPPNPRGFLRHGAGVQLFFLVSKSLVWDHGFVRIHAFDQTDGSSAETQLSEG